MFKGIFVYSYCIVFALSLSWWLSRGRQSYMGRELPSLVERGGNEEWVFQLPSDFDVSPS